MPRSDIERYRAKIRAANRARNRATKALIESHRDEFDRIYAVEAAQVGVIPTGKLSAPPPPLTPVEQQLQDHYRSVVCPQCDAQVGEPCKVKTRVAHHARIRAVRLVGVAS